VGRLNVITWTDNGYLVSFSSPVKVDDLIPVHDAELLIDFNIKTKQQVRELYKDTQIFIETIVSHEPIILPVHEKEMFSKVKTYEEIYLSQRMKWEDDWYIDDFGFYVYCYSFVAKNELLKDERYEE